MFMLETLNIQKPVSDKQQTGCQHDKKLNCPMCDDKFCPTCIYTHIEIHMKKTQPFIQTPTQLSQPFI